MTFQTTIAIFDEYYRVVDAKQLPNFDHDLGCEVRERLQQLDYIVTRVRHLEDVAKQAFARSTAACLAHANNLRAQEIAFDSVPQPADISLTKNEAEAHRAATFEMKLLTESFYYLAGRVRTILVNRNEPLPGLKSFECVGVRDVRNKLLEHAEGKDSQIAIRSFACGGTCGPVLKAARYGGQEERFPDRGLYENASEFRESLDRLLRAVITGKKQQ